MQLTTSFLHHLDKNIKKVYEDYSALALKKAYFTKWMRVAPTTEYNVSFTSDEGIDDWAPLNESGAVKELNRAEGYKISVSSEEYSGKLIVTKKMRIRAKDDTTKLGALLAKDMRKLVLAGRRLKERRAHALLNNSFVTDGSVDPGNGIVLAPDAKALFATDHTWRDSGNTFSNKGTAKFSPAAWDAAREAMSNMTGGDGAPMPKNLTSIVCKMDSDAARRIKRTFKDIVRPVSIDVADATTNINLHQGEGINIIEVPYLTSQDAWFAFDSSESNPFFMHDVQKETLEEKQVDSSLNWIYPATSSFEVACDEMPTSWYGSDGTT